MDSVVHFKPIHERAGAMHFRKLQQFWAEDAGGLGEVGEWRDIEVAQQ